MTEEITHKVFLVPDTEALKYNVVKLKHPRTNTPILCAIDSSKLYEIVHFVDDFSSWLVGDSVTEDGSLYFFSSVDPLFFILPYVNKNEKFCPLEDILMDEEYSDVHNLLKCCTDIELENVFDFKESSGFKVYCYNNTKTLQWLQKKVNYLAHSLKNKKINISDGSKAEALQTNVESEDPKIILSYSCDLISEYISADLFDELLKCLGIEKQEKNKSKNGVHSKSKKQNTSVEPTDDYSKKYSMDKSQNKQQTKLTPAQKRLQKTDKTGMKNISSFFQKK